MITDDDLKKMINVFATKEDLRILKDKMGGLATKDDVNNIMNGIDKVMGELKTTRQEQAPYLRKITI